MVLDTNRTNFFGAVSPGFSNGFGRNVQTFQQPNFNFMGGSRPKLTQQDLFMGLLYGLQQIIQRLNSPSQPRLSSTLQTPNRRPSIQRGFSPSLVNFTNPPAAREPKVFVIDDFTSNERGFQHGTEIVNTIQKRTPKQVDIDARNIYGLGAMGIYNELSNIMQTAKPGDVVNLSQQSTSNDQSTMAVRSVIDQLVARGIRVTVAAGNNGPQQANYLATGTNALIVESTSAKSGVGNIQGTADTTSFSTARITADILNGQL